MAPAQMHEGKLLNDMRSNINAFVAIAEKDLTSQEESLRTTFGTSKGRQGQRGIKRPHKKSAEVRK